MGPSRTTSARLKPRGHVTGRVVPTQGRRSGQADLRRVTIIPPNNSNPAQDTDSPAVQVPSARAAPVSAPAWLADYRRRLLGTDAVVVVVSVLLGQYVAAEGAGFGSPVRMVALRAPCDRLVDFAWHRGRVEQWGFGSRTRGISANSHRVIDIGRRSGNFGLCDPGACRP